LDDDIDEILLPVWSQVARHYKNRSEYVVYEIMNEPHGISNRRWSAVQRMAIEEIRKHDQNKWIIAGGSDWNSINGMLALPRYNDNKLI
jgi:endoglucanase